MNNQFESIENRLKCIEELLKDELATQRKRYDPSPKNPKKQFKVTLYLAGILLKEIIQITCDAIEIGDFTFLKAPFHQIAAVFMNLFNIL